MPARSLPKGGRVAWTQLTLAWMYNRIMCTEEAGQLVIRNCRTEEIRILHQIDQACFPDFMAYSHAELHFYLAHPRAVSKIAERDGKIVGFAVGHCGPRSQAHVITLDVMPDARRCRVGTRLMEILHGEFRRRGMTESMLEVDTTNEAAVRFYAKLGYERRALLPGYYQSRRDAYRMIMLL